MSCQQNPNMVLSPCRKVLVFLVGAFDSLLFGGAVFGWPTLVHVLKMDSVYADLCSDVNTVAGEGINQYKAVEYGEMFNNSRCVALNVTPVFQTGHSVGVEQCAPQDERFALIFTIAVCCYGVPSFAVGFLLHHAGLWATRISAGAMLCLGFIFLGITTREEPNWLFPAIILLALGGNQIRMSGLQLADLFPANKATALTLLSGMYSSSASLFLVFQLDERYHVDRSLICWCLAGVSTFVIWFSFVMPIHHIPYDDDYDKEKTGSSHLYSEECAQLNPEAIDHWIPKHSNLEAPGKPGADSNKSMGETDDGAGGVKMKEFQDLTLVAATFSLSSWLLQLWLGACMMALNVYQMTYNYWITIVSCSPKEAETFSVAYSYVNFASVFVAPIFGVLVDCLVARARKHGRSFRERRRKEIQSNFLPLLLTTLTTFLMYLCLLFFHPVGVYLSLGFMAICRPCLVSVSTAYIRIRFPQEHFNRLVGFHFTLMSLVLLLQYPQFIWSQSMYLPAHATILAVVGFSILNPLHLLVRPFFMGTIGSPRQAAGIAASTQKDSKS